MMSISAFQCDGCGNTLRESELGSFNGHTFPLLGLSATPNSGEEVTEIEKYDLCRTCFRWLADHLKAFRSSEGAS